MENEVSNTSDPVSEQVVISEDKNDSIELYYSSLTSMFPNVDPEYIKKICTNPPFDLSVHVHDDDILAMFVNHLISYNEHIDVSKLDRLKNVDSEETVDDEVLSEMLHLQDLQRIEIEKQNEYQLNEQLFSEFLKDDEEVVNEKLSILINILPDADPEFLRNFIEKNYDNTVLLQQFVESNLIDKNYEKRDQSYAKRQTKKSIEQYTTHFSVEKFIKQFPEPFEYFESNGKKGIYQEKAIHFLKCRHNCLTEQYLSNIYTSNKYNLSLTDEEIISINNIEPAVPDNFDTDDVLLLQEITFIRNKNSIKRYLDDLNQTEEKELQILREKNLLLECQCCYYDLKPTECIECDDNHIFCRRCVIKGTSLAISNGQTSVQCFVCDKEINLNVLRKVLPENSFEMLLKKRQEAEVKAALLEDLVTCPFCPYQMELAPQITIFTCKNHECMKISCRLCGRMNHLPTRCEDVLDDQKGRLFVEEEMSKALIRNCYKCQKPFVKLDGCNKMICYCGAMMCYICRQPIIDYEHFDKAGGCQTNQNSEIFDQEQVEIRRIQAISKLQNDFPDINIPDIS